MALRANLLEAYSRAWVRCVGIFWESRIEGPASSGDDIRCLRSEDIVAVVGMPPVCVCVTRTKIERKAKYCREQK